MTNFIINVEEKWCSEVKKIIHQYMVNRNNHYKIYEYNKKEIIDNLDNLIGQNVYIIDLDIKDNLFLANIIRKKIYLINNQFILLSDNKNTIIKAYHYKLMMVNYVLKNKELNTNILNCLYEINNLFSRNKAITFKNNGEIYRIPYDDILYIEKNKNENSVCVHTENNHYNINGSITNMEKYLEKDICFIKSHRSAIINLNQIKKIDMVNNVIYFKNKSINYLSRDRKKEVENRIKENNELL